MKEPVYGLLAGATLDIFTDKTISDIDALLRQFEAAREKGYAIGDEEYAPGVVCAAVPIFDEYGFVTHSIGISGNDGHLQEPEIRRQMITILKRAGS